MPEHSLQVAVCHGGTTYPMESPFDPATEYPELRSPVAPGPNEAYASVREALHHLFPPGERFGTGERWNPLQEVIEPGQRVFIKPNLVDHKHRYGGETWSVITHPSVVRAVADYVGKALRGDGRIIIGDNPHVDTSWSELSSLYGAERLIGRLQELHGLDVDFVDCRRWHMPDLSMYGWRFAREDLPGDPAGERIRALRDSWLDEKASWLFRGTYNERLETIRQHVRSHRYSFAGSIYDADTYVSIPKLKTHAKVGVTLNIKGLIGTILNKNCLVHWSIGYPRFGGDEYPEPESWLDYPRLYWQHLLRDLLPGRAYAAVERILSTGKFGAAYQRLIRTEYQRAGLLRGAWEGNDTTWRMAADVYRLFIRDPYFGPGGRRSFSVIDGIVGGDTDGPHFPHAVPAGVVLASTSLLAADLVATRLMDLDYTVVRYLDALRREEEIDLDAIEVNGTYPLPDRFFDRAHRYLRMAPPNRWPSLSLDRLAPRGDYLAEQRSRAA